MNTLNKMMILVMMSGVASIAHAENTVVQPATTAPTADGSKIDAKVQKQEARIDHKVAKGKLTQAQGDKMKADVQKVETDKNAMIAQNGGKKLTKAQRKQLHQELKQTKEEIKGSAPVTPATTN